MKKLTGMNIYYDKKGHSYYFDRFSKNSYLIKEDYYQSYNFYANRYVLAIGVVVVIEMFVKNMGLSILSGIAFAGVAEYMFRNKFLKSMVFVPKHKAEGRQTYVEQIANQAKGKIISKTVAYFAIAVLLVLLTFEQDYAVLYEFCLYAMAAFSACLGVTNLIAIIKARGN